MKKITWLTNQPRLRIELTSVDRTGYESLVHASPAIVCQSDSDGGYMWEETRVPDCAYIALKSHLASQWYERKRYPTPQTRRYLGLVVSEVPDELAPLHVFCAMVYKPSPVGYIKLPSKAYQGFSQPGESTFICSPLGA